MNGCQSSRSWDQNLRTKMSVSRLQSQFKTCYTPTCKFDITFPCIVSIFISINDYFCFPLFACTHISVPLLLHHLNVTYRDQYALSYFREMLPLQLVWEQTVPPSASLLYQCLPLVHSLMFPCCRGCVVCLRGNSYQTQQPCYLIWICSVSFCFLSQPPRDPFLQYLPPFFFLHINNIFRPVAIEGNYF